MPEHSAITDPDIHEPKGAASALAGQRLEANGDGTTSWVTPSVDSASLAQAVVTAPQVLALTAATDSTLETDSDYVKWSSGWSTDVSIGSDVSFTTDLFDISETGLYQITLSVNPEMSSQATIAFKFSTDNTNGTLTSYKVVNRVQHTNLPDTMSTSYYINLADGDQLSLWVTSAVTANLTIGDMVMSVRKV